MHLFFSAVIIVCTKGMGNSSDAKVDIAVIQISPYYKKRLLVNHCPLIFARLFSQVEAVNSYRGKQDLFSWKGQLTNNHNPPFKYRNLWKSVLRNTEALTFKHPTNGIYSAYKLYLEGRKWKRKILHIK